MTLSETYTQGYKLEHSGWKWEMWSGSFTDGTAKGWWILPTAGAGDIKGMRRGDPKAFDYATVTTAKLYLQ